MRRNSRLRDSVLNGPLADRKSLQNLYDERSVSRQRVGPPAWCRLESDEAPTIATIDPVPKRLPLGDDARCRCGSAGKPDVSPRFIECTVYGSSRATVVEIEVLPCATCLPQARQFAGPDLRDMGLFNFNNRRIFTHELFNRFTSSITAHETPFHAFCTVITRSYIETQCPIDFVGEDAFRTAYFSFTQIQDLGDSFQCTTCGPNPRVVIFDGVTASYDKKHQTSSLSPPTLIHPDAPKRAEVRPTIESTSIVWGRLRASAQKAVRWRMQLKGSKSRLAGLTGQEDDVADADVDIKTATKQTKKRVTKRDAADAEMRASLPGIVAELAPVNEALSVMFDAYVATEYDKDLEDLRRPYLELLEHVRQSVFKPRKPRY